MEFLLDVESHWNIRSGILVPMKIGASYIKKIKGIAQYNVNGWYTSEGHEQ